MNTNHADRIVDQTLDLLRKKSPDGYEIFMIESSHFEVESKEGKVDTLQLSEPWGISLRVLNGGRAGFAYGTSLQAPFQEDANSSLKRLVEDAWASAEATTGDPSCDFAPPLKDPPPQLPIYDETLPGVSEKRKIEHARLLEEAARSVDVERITKVRKASYQEAISKVTLINSNGLHYSYKVTYATISVMAVAEAGGESEVGWDFDFSHHFDRINPKKTGVSAGRRALDRLGGRRISSGVFPILLENQVASEFLSLLAHAFLSEQVQKGKSNLMGKLGVQYFSPSLSIVDDGLLAEGAGTSPIDGEGTPSQRTLLVHDGEIKGYLYDRFWANRQRCSSPEDGVESTGNSMRHSIKSPPSLGVSNLYIHPGTTPFSSILKSLQKGVFIEEVMGLHTVNPISGDFSLGCAGQWIEKGEKVHPIKSIAIAGNLYQLFKKVTEVGSDLRFFGRIGSPSLLIEGLELSGN